MEKLTCGCMVQMRGKEDSDYLSFKKTSGPDCKRAWREHILEYYARI